MLRPFPWFIPLFTTHRKSDGSSWHHMLLVLAALVSVSVLKENLEQNMGIMFIEVPKYNFNKKSRKLLP